MSNRIICVLFLWCAIGEAMPVLDVSSSKFRFAVAPGNNPPSQNFRILNRGDGILKPTALVPPEYPWLTVSVSGNTGTIGISSSTLAEGIYAGTFTLMDAAAADSPQSIDVKLHVTRRFVTEPERLDIFLPSGGGGFRDVYLPTGSIPEYLPRTQTGGSWLKLTLLAESGVYIRATISSTLAEGSYSGSIDFAWRGQGVGQVPINVTVTSRAILAVDRDSIQAETSPGLEAPDQLIQVGNQGQSVLNWTPASDSSWLRAVQDNDFLRVSFSSAGLAPGTYQGNVRIDSTTAVNAPLTIPVVFRIIERGAPSLKVRGAVDAANYCSRSNCYMAPGSLATLFGSQLAYQTAGASSTPLPTKLGTTRVLVNGSPAELLYVSYGQINYRLPTAAPAGAKWIRREGRPDQQHHQRCLYFVRTFDFHRRPKRARLWGHPESG